MDKKKQASGISGGIFLIGLGVLLFTGWWWPGIMLVIGLSAGAEQIFRGKIASGIGTIAFFSAFPIIWAIVQSTDISWAIIGPFILIAIGVIILVKAFFLKDDVEVVGELE
ncbi:hypothetical protein ACFLXI_08725 [Chloroflexota bacterium]